MAESSELDVRGEHAGRQTGGHAAEHAGERAVVRAAERDPAHAKEHAGERRVAHAEEHPGERAGEHAVAHAHDPNAEPSADWGWHGGFPRASRIGGWAIAAILLLMLIGNHRGRVEDLWLVGIAIVVVGVLVADQMQRRTSWRR